jgi:HrpA-like RNA helicase
MLVLPKLPMCLMQAPSGSQVTIDYSCHPPKVEIRLQELFGSDQTPSIANNTVPLTLQLLSPAFKPVQVTQDLTTFWQHTYPQASLGLLSAAWCSKHTTHCPLQALMRTERWIAKETGYQAYWM